MDSIKSYVFSVCIVAIICGILTKLTEPKGTIGSLIKLLCGIFIMMTALSPIIKLPIYEFQNYFDQLSIEAEFTANIGESVAKEEIGVIVAGRVKEYIMQKAADLGITLDVDLTLENSVPHTVRIVGAISPYKKDILSKYISDHLGIAAEDQQWIS